MSAEDDIRRLIASKDSETKSSNDLARDQRAALAAEILPAWESYLRTCRELAQVLDQSNVPVISLHRRIEKKIGFFGAKTKVVFQEFASGWGLGPNGDYWNLFGILSTDGILFRRVKYYHNFSYTYDFIPYKEPLFDQQGMFKDQTTSADYWTLSVVGGKLHARVADSPDGFTRYYDFDLEETIKEAAAAAIMKYR